MTAADVTAPEATTVDVTSPRAGSMNVRWSWLALFAGAWLIGGSIVVTRALNEGLTDDPGFSPYHLPVYLCLIALGGSSIVLVVRALRRGRPRRRRSRRTTAAWAPASSRSSLRLSWMLAGERV